MAGTVTETRIIGGGLTALTLTWTSDASGDATLVFQMQGAIVRMVTNPGSTAPTDNYDITLVDPDGVDLLAAEGINRDTSTSEQVFPTNTPFHYGDVTFTVANAGDTKDGVCVLYLAWNWR